jgi:hypothetical protein
MKKLLALILLLFPVSLHATVIVQGSFESGITPFVSNYGGATVVSDSTAPNGTHSLMFTFPTGFPAGYSPDIVTPIGENFSQQYNEVYVQFYLKYSSNRIFGSMEHATTTWRPRLKVTYTQLTGPPPAPSIPTPGKMKVRAGTKGRFRSFH